MVKFVNDNQGVKEKKFVVWLMSKLLHNFQDGPATAEDSNQGGDRGRQSIGIGPVQEGLLFLNEYIHSVI